jgi:hypothetical protein
VISFSKFLNKLFLYFIERLPIMSLKDLVTSVIADGKVDASEVAELRAEIYADGKVEREEVDAVFQINDAVSDNVNDPAWTELFSDVISDHFTADGVIDEEEANYLIGKLMADGGVDATEKAALTKIRQKATSIFPAFDAAMASVGV